MNRNKVLNITFKVAIIMLIIYLCQPSGGYSQQKDLNTLINNLKDGDWHVRKEAARLLGEIKDPCTIGPLIIALKDKDSDVRWSAAAALVKIGTPAVEPLIGVLKEKDWHGREEAAWALGEIKDPRAVEPLVVALKGNDLYVR